MLRIRNVLYPTDFSPCAEAAFPYALQLTRRHNATLHVMHVAPLLGLHPNPPTFDSPAAERAARQDQQTEAEQRMNAILRAYDVEDVDARRVYSRGVSPGSTLIAYSEASEIDLIVIGSHGRTGMRRLLLGSVAEELIRHASCPVLVVRTLTEPAMSPPSDRRLLVPFDFSSSAELALRYAHELGEEYDTAIDVLHVIDPGTHVEAYVKEVSERGRMLEQLRLEAHRALEKIDAELGGPSVRAAYHVSVGFPPKEIVEFAHENDSAMIVLSSHGRTGKNSIFIGSVAEHVVRHAPCPVFLARPFGKSLIADARVDPDGGAALAGRN